MRILGQAVKIIAGIVILFLAVGMAFFPASTGTSLAQPPPLPSETPIPPATDTPGPEPSDTPIPEPSDTPIPEPSDTPIPEPSDTPIPEPSDTPIPEPSDTPIPQPTSTQPAVTATPRPTRTPKPGPGCQSIVEGYAFNAAGHGAAGATVHITTAGWSNQMLSDSGGHYAFSSLCSGSYTLQATLPGGQTTQAATAGVNGQNTVRLDLRVSAAASSTPPQPGPTSEPNMPTTGFSGWLLAGGAALGVILLVAAGARRALGSRQD
jgi:Carboxypeptidase regulatory-like domain